MTVYKSSTAAKTWVEETEDKHRDPERHRGFRFPSPWFMKVTGGFRPGWISYVYGKAGIGKTAFLTTSAVQNGIDKVPFLYLALEESVESSIERFVAHMSGISRIKFRDVTLDEKDWPKVYKVASEVGDFHAFFCDDAWSAPEIAAIVANEEIAQVKVVYLDYLQLMQMPNAITGTENVAKASKFLTQLAKGKAAKGCKYAVVAACQLNDDGNPLWSRDPDRDGDLIVEVKAEADTTGKPLPDRREIVIRKARFGAQDSSMFHFNGALSKMGEFYTGPTEPNRPG
jgi:replicative DNA helicase